MADVKRKYDSERRRAQADASKERLAQAARRLFIEQGYAATTIADIAGAAGTAVPTIYAMYGSKRAILYALLETLEADANGASVAKQCGEADDALTQVRLLIAFHVRLFTSGADLLRALRSAGGADPELGALWREGEARRRRAEAPIVRRWAQSGLLRAGISEKEALDVLWGMTGPDFFGLFVVERRWPAERFSAWLEQTIVSTLLEGTHPKYPLS